MTRLGILIVVGAVLAMPIASAHLAGYIQVNYNASYGYNLICNNPSALLPVSKDCPAQAYTVPDGVTHVHVTYVFPYGGVATLKGVLQERLTSLGGDYISYYSNTCSTTGPYLSANSVVCFGPGNLKEWNDGRTHRFFGSGNELACVPLYCSWAVAVKWS